ncbi:N-acetyltransferase eso1, variant 2 [Entomophthora muscae]|uniref:N-acetyltransferase eso1, variant 2 n=1 Tax=Entomophthora muscae TaxID=34485 RepID=A0ACC2T131_9FUNG|nr:N-acetyltransferase eso1, variant 2 [Entomophthora muscae]
MQLQGVAHNKYLAKIGSGMNKPNKQTIFLACHAEGFLTDFPVAKVPSLGGKNGEVIQEKFGSTIGQIRSHSLEALSRELGPETAKFLYDFARGENSDPVISVQATKSMMAAKSLRPALVNFEQLEKWLRVLSTELLDRLLDQTQPMRWPRTLTITHFAPGQRENQGKSKSGTMPPHASIQNAPSQLWRKALSLCQGIQSLFPCSRLAISVGAMEEMDGRNKSILSFFQPCSTDNTQATSEAPPQKRLKAIEVSPEPPGAARCPHCSQNIELHLFPDHLDYHVAAKLQASFDQEAKLSTHPPSINIQPKSSPSKSRKGQTPPTKQQQLMQRFFKPS